MLYTETDPFTGETSTFGGIAEASAEYHARGEYCPWDCWRCEQMATWEPDTRTPEQRAADDARRLAERDAYLATLPEPPF